jgi:hypothetical protein
MTIWRATVFVIGMVSISLIILNPQDLSRIPGFPAHVIRGWQGVGQVPPAVAGLAMFLAQFLSGLVVLYVIPGRVAGMASALRGGWSAWLRFLTVGVLFGVLLAGVGLLAVLAVHTFPLSIILAAIFSLSAFSGSVSLAYALGRWLARKAAWAEDRPAAQYGLGLLLLFALTRLPWIGIVFLAAIWLTGAGTAVATHFGSGQAWSLAPLLAEKFE